MFAGALPQFLLPPEVTFMMHPHSFELTVISVFPGTG